MGALGHRVGDDAVDADGGEDERQRREQAEHDHVEAAAAERAGDALVHRPHVGDRLIGIEAVHLVTDGRNRRERVARRAHGDVHRPDRPAVEQRLAIRHVQLRPIARVEAAVLDVAGDADDLVPARRVLVEGDAFADRILVGKMLVRQRLVDHGDARAGQGISRGELVALEQRNVHRAEEAVGHKAERLFGRVLRPHRRPSFDEE